MWDLGISLLMEDVTVECEILEETSDWCLE